MCILVSNAADYSCECLLLFVQRENHSEYFGGRQKPDNAHLCHPHVLWVNDPTQTPDEVGRYMATFDLHEQPLEIAAGLVDEDDLAVDAPVDDSL